MTATKFVKREIQLAALNDALNRALKGEGNVAFITGEAGAGKTMLLHEFMRQAEAVHRDLVYAVAGCTATGEISTPYLPFAELTTTLLSGGKEQAGVRFLSDEHKRRLQDIYDTAKHVAVEVVPELISVFAPGWGLAVKGAKALWDRIRGERQAEKGESPAEVGEAQLFQRFTRFVSELATQHPLVLALDDLQLADSHTCALLFHLGQRIGALPVLIVGTFRPHEISKDHPLHRPWRLLSRYGAIQIGLDLYDLRPEDRVAMEAFVEAFLDANYAPHDFSDDFRDLILERTEGNAFFVDQLLKLCADKGWIVQEDSHWRQTTELDPKLLPEGVRQLIADRMEGLADSDLEVLQVASIQGEEFVIQVVVAVLERDLDQVLKRLDEELIGRYDVVAAARTVEASGGVLDIYRFRHGFYQDYLYSQLSAARRRRWHAKSGETLRGVMDESWPLLADELAWHFEEGGRWAGLAECALVLSKRNLAQYAAIEAIEWAEKGIAALERIPQEEQQAKLLADLEWQWGRALYYADRYLEARPHHERALIHYQSINDQEGEANTIKALGDVDRMLAEYELARGRYEEALPIFRDIGDRLGEANTITALGDLALAQQDFSAAKKCFENALAIYEAIGDRHWRSYVLPHLADVHNAMNDQEEAIACCQRAAELARSIGVRGNLRGALFRLAALWAAQRDFEASLTCCEELLVLYPDDTNVLRRRAQVHEQRGNWAAALADFRRIVELVPDNPWAHNDVGSALRALGEYKDAAAAYGQAITLASDDADRALFHRNRADTGIEMGHYAEAEADCQQALALALDHPYSHGRQGELDLARGRFDAAEECFRQALELGEERIWQRGLSAALTGLGRAEEAQTQLALALENADADDREDARKKLQRVAEQAPKWAALVNDLLALIDRASLRLPPNVDEDRT